MNYEKYMADQNLSSTEKQIMAIIIQNVNDNQTTINNQQIATVVGKTVVTVSNCISSLKQNGYIETESIHRGRRIKLIKEG